MRWRQVDESDETTENKNCVAESEESVDSSVDSQPITSGIKTSDSYRCLLSAALYLRNYSATFCQLSIVAFLLLFQEVNTSSPSLIQNCDQHLPECRGRANLIITARAFII